MISTTNYLRGHLTVLALVGIACSRLEILSTLILQLILAAISFAVGLGIAKGAGKKDAVINGERKTSKETTLLGFDLVIFAIIGNLVALVARYVVGGRQATIGDGGAYELAAIFFLSLILAVVLIILQLIRYDQATKS